MTEVTEDPSSLSELRRGTQKKLDFGSGTRRRPKPTGLCRGKHAEAGYRTAKTN